MSDKKTEAIPLMSDTALEHGFDLLESVNEKHDLTVRDDQYEYAWFLDAIRLTRQKGKRFRLVDSGRFEQSQLEWLLEAGSDLYTSSKIRIDFGELGGLQKSAKRGRAVLAFFQIDPLITSDEDSQENTSGLLALAKDGIHIYLSNREHAQDFEQLGQLAESCHSGGTRLVYYHHGELVPELQELVRFPLWLHLSDLSLQEEASATTLLDLLSSSSRQAEFVLSIEKNLDHIVLKDILAAGAYVLFQRAQFDYRSPFKELEKAAAKRQPGYTAFYLYPNVML